MSEFMKQVRAGYVYPRERKPIYALLKTAITEIKDIEAEMRCLNKYEIKVAWETHFFCETGNLHHAIDNSLRQLNEAVYGEFRQDLIELERAVYEWDFKKMTEGVAKLLKETNV